MFEGLADPELDAWMNRALDLAGRAEGQGEVPVGALVLWRGDLVAEAGNSMITRHDPTAHAEMVALRMAGERLGNYRLPGVLVVVTLEPCLMCYSAMVHARIGGLIYGAADFKTGVFSTGVLPGVRPLFNHQFPVRGGVCAEAASAQLSGFFQKRRESRDRTPPSADGQNGV